MTITNSNIMQATINCLILSQPGYHHRGLVLRFITQTLKSGGTAVSSAPENNILGKRLEINYGPRLFQFSPISIARHINKGYQFTYKYPAFDTIPTSLSLRDTDIKLECHPFGSTMHFQKHRNRRLDSCHTHPLDLLHVAEPPSRVLEILAGAESLIKKNQPALIIECLTQDHLNLLESKLSHLNYLLLDSNFQHVETTAKEDDCWYPAQTETLFIGLPRKFVESGGLAVTLWPYLKGQKSTRTWKQQLSDQLLLEARNGGVQFSEKPNTYIRYKFDEQIVCEGLYPPERSENTVWRWLGPRPSAKIQLPRPTAGHYKLELAILDTVFDPTEDSIRIFYAGTKLASSIEKNDHQYTLYTTIEIPLDSTDTDLSLVLSVSATKRPSADDPRILGICLAYVDLIKSSPGDNS